MVRSAEMCVPEARIAEFKRLITTGNFDTLEELEDAVDAFWWGDDEQAAPVDFLQTAGMQN